MLAILFGIGFALLAITLLILSRTKWGQTKPFTKCVVLSILAHVWLLMYALGTREVLPQGDPNGSRQSTVAIRMENPGDDWMTADPSGTILDEGQADAALRALANSNPNEVAPGQDEPGSPTGEGLADIENAADNEELQEPAPWDQTIPLGDLPLPEEFSAPAQLAGLENESFDAILADTVSEIAELPELPELEVVPEPETELSGEALDSPSSELQPAALAQSELAEQLPNSVSSSANSLPNIPPNITPSSQAYSDPRLSQSPPPIRARVNSASARNVPHDYRLRQAPNRLQIASAYGASAETEQAVKSGLEWLVRAQSTSGAWIAGMHGAGTETKALGLERHGTGARADTGISGLALLAFLSAGHTHLEGEHRQTVTAGLRYLLDAQMPSGDLAGRKQMGKGYGVLNARMYCHSIATLALAEAYVMTKDAELRDALVRATQYSLGAQDPQGGGWRYTPREPGDLSQFGWQAMALKSAERAGLRIPLEVKQKMYRFLDSCSAGAAGGLATYRPGEGHPTAAMTAEALASRVMLGRPLAPGAEAEAKQALLNHLPGTDVDNVYYWYYATLGLFQMQDESWLAWNRALKSRLIQSQIAQQPSGGADLVGSWEPDPMWGGYGGRVYSTAMSCLCLEVYYRFLPMYKSVNIATRPVRMNPAPANQRTPPPLR